MVANEVKELAKQTAAATDEIRHKIEAIQSGSLGAAEAIEAFTSIINRVDDISTTIASAIEQQTATTTEIGHSVEEAARGSSEISENIHGVAEVAEETSRGASDTLQAANSLAKVAEELKTLVGHFRLA